MRESIRIAVAVVLVLPSVAQGYEIEWSVIAAGGGAGAGGDYELLGTIGHGAPPAGADGYELSAGFWGNGALCAEVGGVPRIAAGRVGSELQLSWQAVPAAVHYDVVTGDLSLLRAGAGAFGGAVDGCVADGVTGFSALTAIDGIPRFYLVRAVACAGSSYDSDGASQSAGRDLEIAQSAQSCP